MFIRDIHAWDLSGPSSFQTTGHVEFSTQFVQGFQARQKQETLLRGEVCRRAVLSRHVSCGGFTPLPNSTKSGSTVLI